MISFLIKILLAIAGLISALFFLVIGLTNRSRSYVRTAGMVCLITLGIIVAIIVVETLLKDVNKNHQNKKTALVTRHETGPEQ